MVAPFECPTLVICVVFSVLCAYVVSAEVLCIRAMAEVDSGQQRAQQEVVLLALHQHREEQACRDGGTRSIAVRQDTCHFAGEERLRRGPSKHDRLKTTQTRSSNGHHRW